MAGRPTKSRSASQSIGYARFGRIALLGQEDRLRDRQAETRRDRVVEELVVRRPPEGIVDDVRAVQDGVLQRAAVVLDLV
jgi:hypothetical protein